MSVNFGKYNIPPTLQRLIDLQHALGDDEQFYLGLHFYLSLENFRYFNTPSDVVVFGNVGMDGIHYGFLTDFGSVSDLEDAPIVCVSPMDFDRPTRIVAKNLCEFLTINLTDGVLFYNQFENEDKYLEAKNQWSTGAEPSEHESLVREKITQFLAANIYMPIIDNPYRYVQNVELERQGTASIQTLDGLGVTAPLLQGEEHIHFLIHGDTDPNLGLLQKFFDFAPVASRLAFVRVIQLQPILQDNQELCKIVTEALIKIGLTDEAARLLEAN